MSGELGIEFAIAAAVVFVSGVVRGFSGFGAAMLMMPVLGVLYAPVQAVALTMGLGFLANLQLVPGAVRTAAWREVLPLAAAALPAIPLGALVLLSADPLWMRRAISVIILFSVAVLASGWRWRGARGTATALTAGGLTGFLNGATGAGGAPVVVYLLAGPNSAATNRANLICFYAFLNGGTVFNLAINGVIDEKTLWRVLLLTPVLVLAIWTGTRLFKKSSEPVYRRVALVLLLGVALFGLFYK